MVTDTINVSSDGSGREEALLETEKLADYISLGSKQRLRFRLLAEETLGLVAAISKDFTARYRAESLETGKCIIHLEADADMDYGKRKEFINESLEMWTHNKTIQKAVESLRLRREQKEYLKSLKRKG